MPSVRALSVDIFVQEMRARMPFKYGIATMTALPHLMLRMNVLVDRRPSFGWAADHLPPKWFTKDPNANVRDEIEDMLLVIRSACARAIEIGERGNAYELWRELSAAQSSSPPKPAMPALLLNFGVSLVERCVIDAVCRATRTTLVSALRNDVLMSGGGDVIAKSPVHSIIVRHTIGLADPLTASTIDDGLPDSLTASVRTYGLTHFKIKLSGDVHRDVERLKEIAAVPGEREYVFTLDGNENFHSVESLETLWATATALPMMRRLLFLEQPLHRDIALSVKLPKGLPATIIDESDATSDSLERAIECGYAGTSHKNCKGVFKSVLNAKLLTQLRHENPSQTFIHSAEDLSNVGPIALAQDLAVVASLGIAHAERNGHHYFRGLSAFDESIQDAALAAHPDLYERHERGFVTPKIRDGRMSTASIIDAPFGAGFDFDRTTLTPLGKWDLHAFCRSVMP